MTGFASKNNTTPVTQSLMPLLNLGDDCSSPAQTPIAQINKPIMKMVMNVDCISENNVFRNIPMRSNKFPTSFFSLS